MWGPGGLLDRDRVPFRNAAEFSPEHARQLGRHGKKRFASCLVSYPHWCRWCVCVLWWAVDLSGVSLCLSLPVSAGIYSIIWPWSGMIQSAENKCMSKYINRSIASLVACFSCSLWLSCFFEKVLMCHIREMGQTISPSSSLSSWTLCTRSMPDSSILLMLVYRGKNTTLDFVIHFNLHYRNSDNTDYYPPLRDIIVLIKYNCRNCSSSSRIKKDRHTIKYVTEPDVFRFVSESGPNSDYIIQDALTSPSPSLSQPVCRSGWEVLALIAKSHLVRAIVLFLQRVTHVDRCLAARAQTGVDLGRSEQQWGGLRRAVPWQTASELILLRCVLVPVCAGPAGEHRRVWKASVSSAHAGNHNALVVSVNMHGLN